MSDFKQFRTTFNIIEKTAANSIERVLHQEINYIEQSGELRFFPIYDNCCAHKKLRDIIKGDGSVFLTISIVTESEI